MGAFGTTQPSSTISHAHGGWCLAVWCMALLWYMGLVQEEWARWMKPTAEPNVMGRGMEEVNASQIAGTPQKHSSAYFVSIISVFLLPVSRSRSLSDTRASTGVSLQAIFSFTK